MRKDAYISPLPSMRSYRLNPELDEQALGSVTYSNKIDPQNIFCRFDLHGVCNDDACPWQHLKTINLSGKNKRKKKQNQSRSSNDRNRRGIVRGHCIIWECDTARTKCGFDKRNDAGCQARGATRVTCKRNSTSTPVGCKEAAG